MEIYQIIFIFAFGLIIGSFLSALTYRLPRGQNFFNDRSRCDECKKKIEWYDNIPLISYLMLGGKCRNCAKKISLRYPLIEISTALTFALLVIFKHLSLNTPTDFLLTVYYLFMATILNAVFIIDLENQLIPDQLVFLLIIVQLIELIAVSNDKLYSLLFAGFTAALFLFSINLITKGKGMGLGDVKLALFAGILLGFPLTITWLFMSFIIGAIVGIILLLSKLARFGERIAFGPFLIFTLYLILFWGNQLTHFILPYIY